MTLNKTIVVSMIFHLCFFSAALLILGGGGKLHETEVHFISLAADEPKAVKAASVPEKVAVVKKAVKAPVALNVEPETAIADVAIEKVEEIKEDVIPEEVVHAAVETVKEESAAEAVDHIEEIVAAEAADQPSGGNPDLKIAAHGAGMLPGKIDRICMAIERVKTYPVIARKRGMEGTVHVSFNVMEDGHPHRIKILKSSGFSILDKATVRVVKKAAPFPLVASTIVLPVSYRLRN